MYNKKTHGIIVSVEPEFLEDQSRPEDDHYVWAYKIKITNSSGETVKLVERYWQITDNQGRQEEVRGPGVVGKMPELKAGESFEYTSGAPLPTPSGLMVGQYTMQLDTGTNIDIDVPAFSLDSPYQHRALQ